MCGQFFDIDGHGGDHEINQRTIGLSLRHLQNVPQVVAIANGRTKVKAIYAALCNRYASVLITDDETAQGVIALAEERLMMTN
jgi:deoxyribonucleoside regulator